MCRYPFRLGYAMTIHKSQSDTLDLSVVDIGIAEKSLGLAFLPVILINTSFLLAHFVVFGNENDESYEILKTARA